LAEEPSISYFWIVRNQKKLEDEGPPEPVRLRTAEMVARRGVCGQGNGDRGMVVSLVDALVVPDLAQLGMVVATTWPSLARGVSHHHQQSA